MSSLCDALTAKSLNANEIKIAELICNVSILAEIVTEKLPTIINTEMSKIQEQLYSITQRMDAMQNTQYSAPGLNYQTPLGPPPLPGYTNAMPLPPGMSNAPTGFNPPKLPSKAGPATMLDELKEKLKTKYTQ